MDEAVHFFGFFVVDQEPADIGDGLVGFLVDVGCDDRCIFGFGIGFELCIEEFDGCLGA